MKTNSGSGITHSCWSACAESVTILSNKSNFLIVYRFFSFSCSAVFHTSFVNWFWLWDQSSLAHSWASQAINRFQEELKDFKYLRGRVEMPTRSQPVVGIWKPYKQWTECDFLKCNSSFEHCCGGQWCLPWHNKAHCVVFPLPGRSSGLQAFHLANRVGTEGR